MVPGAFVTARITDYHEGGTGIQPKGQQVCLQFMHEGVDVVRQTTCTSNYGKRHTFIKIDFNFIGLRKIVMVTLFMETICILSFNKDSTSKVG